MESCRGRARCGGAAGDGGTERTVVTVAVEALETRGARPSACAARVAAYRLYELLQTAAPDGRERRSGLAIFDLAYHVASLAAVFLALVIGILVGVVISSGGFVLEGRARILFDRSTS